MQAKDVILMTIASSDQILRAYLDGLSDADLLLVPVAGMNPMAWQIGHLIASERGMVEQVRAGVSPALPAGFAEAHSTDAAKKGDFSGMLPLADYLALSKAQRAASLQVIESMTDAELATETGLDYAANFAALLNMVGVHVLMHLGQFVAVRRALDKPVVI